MTTTIFPDWHFSRWHAVDDRVRGGSSQSHLDPVPVPAEGVVGNEKRSAARFWGTLDTKTLGGAGFASRKYQFGPTPLSLPRAQYQGVILTVSPPSSDPKESVAEKPETFTLVFKTQFNSQPPSKPKLPPSPDPASLSYEAQFTAPSSSSDVSGVRGTEGRQVRLAFDDFVPTYRGRPVDRNDPKYRPFDPATIYEVSLMCRSDFGKQEGEFELVLHSLAAWKKEGNDGGKGGRARDGCWTWLSSTVFGSGQGRVALPDNQKQ